MQLSISFLSIQNEKEKIETLNEIKTNYIHYDVMDGIFTENKSLSFSEMQNLNLTKPKDVHLMVSDVKKYIDEFKMLNPEYLTFHIETNINHEEMLDYIHSLGIKAGVSLNPDTDIEKIKPILNKVDLVLVMTVVPGVGGQKFIDVTDKIRELNKLKNEYSFLIEVDGGINDKTIELCKNAGADIAVIGSYITNDNIEMRVKEIWEKM